MKKRIISLITAFILVGAMVVSVQAEITDDSLISKTLMNGTEIQVHSNPYFTEGITEMEFRIIEKMREKASEIGFDINADSSYHAYEEMIYKQLYYCGNPAINAEQLDGIYTIIENCGEMLKSKMEGKIPTEGTISEGFYAGATEEERDIIRQEVFRDYADKAIRALDIVNTHVGFGAYPEFAEVIARLYFDCNKDVVEGNNYLVEPVEDVSKDVYDSMAGYFSGSYQMTEVKTYPENNKIVSTVTVDLKTVSSDYDQEMDIFLLKYDGTVEKVEYKKDEYPYYTFEINECGYIAWGTPKKVDSTPTQTPDIGTTPVPTNSNNNSGQVTAPQTADLNNLAVPTILLLTGAMVLVLLKINKEKTE